MGGSFNTPTTPCHELDIYARAKNATASEDRDVEKEAKDEDVADGKNRERQLEGDLQVSELIFPIFRNI
jgi:hypothetical protein